jgi:hypothetical protein
MAFQVSYSNDIAEREAAALIDCSKELKVEGTFIITEDLYKKERVHGVDICFMPLWLFLLADKGLIEEGKI